MIEHISTFINTLLGIDIPVVVPVILGFVLVSILLKKFFEIFGFDSKLWNFASYVIIGYLALSSLGGFEWRFLLS